MNLLFSVFGLLELVFTGCQHLVLLVGQEPIVGLAVAEEQVLSLLDQCVFLATAIVGGVGHGVSLVPWIHGVGDSDTFGRHCLVGAGDGRLFLKLREYHLTLCLLESLVENLEHGRRLVLACGWLGFADVDVTPELVAEGVAVSSLDTPVRDCLAFTFGRAHDDGEFEFFANFNNAVGSVAFGSFEDIAHVRRMIGVNVEHRVTTNESDAAANRPGVRTRIGKSPDLLKLLAWCQDRAISDGITEEVSLELGVRHDRLRLRLYLGWLSRGDVSYSLHLGRCIRRGCCRFGLGSLGTRLWQAISYSVRVLAIVLFAKSRYRYIPYGCLELDERMCSVMVVRRKSFAVGAEISVMADSTLVAIANDVGILICAEWAIAMDAIVTLGSCWRVGYGFVKWDEAVIGVVTSSILDAARAVIPIWAIQALVANSNDILYIVSRLNCGAIGWQTLSHPSQMAAWRALRPGDRSLLANVLRVVCSEAGIKAWLG